LGQKPCFGVKNPVLGSKRGVSEHSEFTENSEFVLFQTFQKLQKNDVKIKFKKSRKNLFQLKNQLKNGLKCSVYTSYLRLRFRKFRCVMWSISSTFYARVFCTQFLAPKLQTQNTALQFLVPNFCTQKARVKR